MWKWVVRVGTVIVVLSLTYRLADALARRADPLPVVPDPNGYVELLSIADQLRHPEGELIELGPGEIQEIALDNKEHLDALRRTLRTPIAVPVRMETDWVEDHAGEVTKLKRTAVALSLQSRAETLSGNTNQAAIRMLDVVRLGQVLPRGGLYSDALNGLMIEVIGGASLRGMAPDLDSATCRRIAVELEQMETGREPVERTMQTERSWSAMSFGLIGRIGDRFRGDAELERHARLEGRHKKISKQTRRLMLLLAARAVELETGSGVTEPGQLVPGVLKQIPIDPETGRPFTAIPLLTPME